MAKNGASPALQSEVDGNSADAIRVIVADSEPIFRVGVRKIFAIENDICVVAQVETAPEALASVEREKADVILFERGLSESPYDTVSSMLAVAPSLKIILVMLEVTEEETVELLRRGVRGVVTRSIAPDLLIKCIRKVHDGETWLDNRAVNWVIQAYRAKASELATPRDQVKLSTREVQIIAGVTQGLRNKEIAQEVGTTEQVVKNYLRKIYDKLGVSDRLELALFCMHHHLLDNYSQPEVAMSATSSAS
jgi:DNA-binding NarL/FixJ family response regulator